MRAKIRKVLGRRLSEPWGLDVTWLEIVTHLKKGCDPLRAGGGGVTESQQQFRKDRDSSGDHSIQAAHRVEGILALRPVFANASSRLLTWLLLCVKGWTMSSQKFMCSSPNSPDLRIRRYLETVPFKRWLRQTEVIRMGPHPTQLVSLEEKEI